jgi:YD repeat-containing protein
MRRATSQTDVPGANACATIDRFCSTLHRRLRSGPESTSTRLIAPSLAPVQTTVLARVLTEAGVPPCAQGGRYRTVTSETLPDGIIATYGFDNASQLTAITYAMGSTTVGALTYAYDLAGQVASRGGGLFQSVLPAAVTSGT